MGDARGGCLQLSHRGRGSPLGITLECLASGLHEYHDQTGKRLTQQQGRDDGQHGHQVRGKAAREDAAHGLPHDWCAGDGQPCAPQELSKVRVSCCIRDEPGQNEAERADRQEVEPTLRALD